MTLDVIVYRIDTSYNAPYAAMGYVVGNFIHSRLNDSTGVITVEIRDSSTDGGGTLIGSPTSGPGLFFGNGGSSTRLTPNPLYKYCTGTTLSSISPIPNFPYSFLNTSANAAECAIVPVCDLDISNSYSVIPASGAGVNDGQVTVSATSSNGVIRFSLIAGFTYASGQTSGTFTGLVPGQYTIYAIDAYGCTDSIVVNIGITTVYGTKYRLDYQDDRYGVVNVGSRVNNSRIDIEERLYAGTITAMKGGESPFILKYRTDQNDKYNPVIYSNAEIQLMSEVSLQYAEFFTQDDRKYRVKFYKYESGAWSLKWVGFIVPAFYSEPYLCAPFETTLTASDNLALLDNDDFVDINGNQFKGNLSQLFILSQILQKTNQTVSLRSCVNLFENSMTTAATDDPIAQAYVDSRIYYDDKKVPAKTIDVLKSILIPYGARIFQSNGYWYIVRIDNSVGPIEFREYDYQGVYTSNGSVSTTVTMDYTNTTGNIRFCDESQMMQFLLNYGRFEVVHNLTLDNNLIDSGSFEKEYIKTTGGGTQFFDGWNFFMGENGTQVGWEAVSNGDSQGAFYADHTGSSIGTALNRLYTSASGAANVIKIVGGGQTTLKFQVLIAPFLNYPMIKFGFKVKISDGVNTYYLFTVNNVATFVDAAAATDDWNDQGFVNELYISTYNQFQSFEFNFLVPDNQSTWDMEVSFHWKSYQVDVTGNNFATLTAINTNSRIQGRRKYYYHTTDLALYDYKLDGSPVTESPSNPSLINTHDYGVSNQSRWRLQNTVNVATNPGRFIKKVLIDNVSISERIIVNNETLTLPPETVTYPLTANANNVLTLTKEVLLGDLPDIDNAKEIYRSYLRLSNGTPTTNWHRKGETNYDKLLQILLNDYSAHLSAPMKKLNGTLLCDYFVSFLNTVSDPYDDRKYHFGLYELDDKACLLRSELTQVAVGTDGLPPAESHGFTIGFSIGYDS